MDIRIKKIIDKWYLTEPALLMTILAHELVPNTNMSCPFRCGKGKIEYNSGLINKLSDSQLENSLKAEAIRIILKHPYERQPNGCKRKSMALGSNLVLSDNYDFSDINMPKPSDYSLPENESYEWYSMRIEGNCLAPNESDNTITSPSEDNETSDSTSNQKASSKDDLDGMTDKSEGDQSPEGQSDSDSVSDNADSRNDQAESSNFSQPSNGGQPSSDRQGSGSTDEDFFVLTLADGTTMRISKGNSKSQSSDPQESNSNNIEPDELDNYDSNNRNESAKKGEHPDENRKFNNSQRKIQVPSEDLSSL